MNDFEDDFDPDEFDPDPNGHFMKEIKRMAGDVIDRKIDPMDLCGRKVPVMVLLKDEIVHYYGRPLRIWKYDDQRCLFGQQNDEYHDDMGVKP